MGQRLNVGVIGVGTFGALHAEVYRQIGAYELKAVADVNQGRLAEVCAKLDVRGYSDYHELLSRDDIDAVSVCTADDQHVGPALAAVAAGKHLLVEKPLALTPQDCDQIIAAAAHSGAKLMVGQILRFDPRYFTARQKIKNGEIGQLVHLVARRNNPIGSARRLSERTSVVFFLGVHDLDFLNWVVGKKPESVYARATSRVLRDTPDTVLAVLSYPDGPIASLEVSWVLPPSLPWGLDARLDAVGTAGALYVNGGCESVGLVGDGVTYPELNYAPLVWGQRVGILRDELAHFADCVLNDREPLVSGQDGKAAVEVACAIQASYESGTEIQVP